jgi:hypothetical protein
VRNSGALAVVEGVGQHGCEYMTGGVVVVLGPLGLNFGSGMTGGLSYVFRSEAENVLQREFVSLGAIDAQEEIWLRWVLERHCYHTGSPRTGRLLALPGPLPLSRVQPLHFQGSVEATWMPILAQLKYQEISLPLAIPEVISELPMHA